MKTTCCLLSRRRLLGSAALSAAPLFVPGRALGLNGATPPSRRIVMGFIGVGGMGSGHVRAFSGHEDVQPVAVCDVRQEHRERAKALVDKRNGDTSCTAYHDFRELLARPDIDAIMMAAPDHWHVLIGLEAARRGKHMYFEKPLGRTVEEALALRAAVRRSGIVFQFGTQQRSSREFRFACELVRNGRLGQLKEILLCSAGSQYVADQPVEQVPAGFDYDMWLGPAPWAPYCFQRCTRNWTLIYDYSLGCISGAWGIHDVDIAQWANRADDTAPIRIEGRAVFPREGLYDTAWQWEIESKYANGVTLVHMDPRTARRRARQFERGWFGILFVGSEGWIYASRQGMEAEPRWLLSASFGLKDERLPRSNDHRRDFLDAIQLGRPALCPIDSAVNSDIACHQADIATRLARPLVWDPKKEQFIGDAQANSMLGRAMRSPWRLHAA